MTSIELIAERSGSHAPNRITVKDGQAEICTVYCDQIITFTSSQLSLSEIKEIVTIAENFNLFFNNLTK